MKVLLALLLFFSFPVITLGQIEISPGRIDFGEVGTSLVFANYWKGAFIRNVSGDTLELRTTYRDSLQWDVGEADAGLTFLSPGAFVPGDSAYLSFRLAVYGWGSLPYFEFADTVWLEVRPKGRPENETIKIPVPVYANVIPASEPFFSAEKAGGTELCRCRIPEDVEPGSSIERLELWVMNPYSATNTDTVWVDSLQVEELGGNGIPAGRLEQSMVIFDTVAPYDWLNGISPKHHGQLLPAYVLPGMFGSTLIGVPTFKPGNKQSVARAFIRRPRDSKAWVLEDTLQYYLGVWEAGPLVGGSPGRDPIVMAPPLDVTKQDGISVAKCGLPDNVPVWADTVYIRGPRQDAIDLVKRTGSPDLPKFPALLGCLGGDVQYNIEVHRARTTPGTTVDTIVVEYHYEDPVRGRVDSISKRPFTIIIEPRTTGVVVREEEPFGTLTAIPNPTKDRIRFAWRSFGRSEAVGVRLFDALGRDVFARPIAFELSGSVEIDVSGLPAGAYRAVVEGREGNVLAVRPVMVVR